MLNRSVQVFDSHADADQADKEFWWAQTPEARLQHLLLLRRINYGPDRVSSGLHEFLRLLHDHEVDYLLVGGFAVALHGYARTTADIDVWVSRRRENAEKLVVCLKAFGFDLPELTPEVFEAPDRIVRMGEAPLRIEVLTDIDGVDFESCRARAVLHDLEGENIRVISLADLKVNKRAAGRPKDLDDLDHLP